MVFDLMRGEFTQCPLNGQGNTGMVRMVEENLYSINNYKSEYNSIVFFYPHQTCYRPENRK